MGGETGRERRGNRREAGPERTIGGVGWIWTPSSSSCTSPGGGLEEVRPGWGPSVG